ncbi:hypothetical protein [Streptomyces yanii]|uniref:Uncharacterized protein n=1 Tax=Streptomyces yanii TaxID=78510 RepID=A0ABV5R7Z4_9ACTN
MLIMDAVLETYKATDFALWPIADSPSDHLLALSGQLSARELGTVMAVLTSYEAVIGAMTYSSWDVELRAAGGVTPQNRRTLADVQEAASRRTQQ